MGLPPNIVFELKDHGKICNVAIYKDLCRHQRVDRFMNILEGMKINHPITTYLTKISGVKFDVVRLAEIRDFHELYCPPDEEMRERMILSNQIFKSYKNVQTLEELKQLTIENTKKKEELNEKLLKDKSE
jgi:hypothetical protein